MSSFSLKFAAYFSFIKNAFLNMLAYRLRYYTGIITYLLFVSVNYYIWKAVYDTKEAETVINGFTFSEMVTYISVGWIARSLYFSNIDETINDLVQSGEIGIYLLKPVNFYLMQLFQAFGESLFRLIFFSLPIGIAIIVFFPVSAPTSFQDFILFLISTFSGFLVLAQLNFLIGLLAFSLKSIENISRAKYFFVQLFSGLLMPLTFFPEWLQSILDVLPFKIIAYIPLRFYLGQVPAAEVSTILANQLIWISGMYLLCVFFWSRATAKLTVQGG